MVRSIELRVHSYARLYAQSGLTQLGIRSVDANPHDKTEEFVYTALGKVMYACIPFLLRAVNRYVNINSHRGGKLCL